MEHSDRSSNALPELAVLISGRGSNMLALASACASGELRARISLVISNKPNAKGLESARELGIDTMVIDHTAYPDRASFDQALNEQLKSIQPDWVVLAGFMRILTPEFVNAWRGRVLNIHPSLLPLYPGLDTHQRAIDAGDAEAGASVHIVTPELDAGPVVAQVRVPILPNDTSESLAARVLDKEHQLFIDALKVCLDTSPTS